MRAKMGLIPPPTNRLKFKNKNCTSLYQHLGFVKVLTSVYDGQIDAFLNPFSVCSKIK